MNRHGDGRPARATWYQSISRTAHDVVVGTAWRWPVVNNVRGLAAQRFERVFACGGCRPDQQPSVVQPELGRDRRDDRTELATQTVASRRRTDRAADREGDAQRNRRGIVEKGAPQGLGSGRATGACQRLERSGVRGSSRSSREPGAALESPGLDDRPTGTGAHAGAKAVLAGSTASVGLVCALHEFSTFSDMFDELTGTATSGPATGRAGQRPATEPERIKARASSNRSTTADRARRLPR